MYTTVIHPIRKALCLSLEEYHVLDLIYSLSKNNKFGGWCIASKKYISGVLDISERKVFRMLKTLEEKELIEKNKKELRRLRTTDSFNSLVSNKDSWMIGVKGNDGSLMSGKKALCQNGSDYDKMAVGDYDKMAGYNSIINYNILSKDNSDSKESQKPQKAKKKQSKSSVSDCVDNSTSIEGSSSKPAQSFGSKKLNELEQHLKRELNREAWKQSRQKQRFSLNHIQKLLEKIGAKEFRRRLEILKKDKFMFGNSGSLAYFYNEMKSMPVLKVESKPTADQRLFFVAMTDQEKEIYRNQLTAEQQKNITRSQMDEYLRNIN